MTWRTPFKKSVLRPPFFLLSRKLHCTYTTLSVLPFDISLVLQVFFHSIFDWTLVTKSHGRFCCRILFQWAATTASPCSTDRHKESRHVSPRNMTINANPSPLPHKEDLKLLSFELNVVYRRNESLNYNNIAIGKVSMLWNRLLIL
jgi:hypothetical protein